MNWGRPELLHLLWLLIPAAWFFIALTRRRIRRLHQLTDPAMLSALAPGVASARTGLRLAIWLAGIALLVVSLARPQWGEQLEEVHRRGLDIVVALDTSRSMLAEDLKPNRLQQAKWGIRDLVEQLQGDRVGLVAFAGEAFLQCPLTIDYAAFMMTLDDVYCGIIPVGGTALAESLAVAMKSFDEDTASDKVVILITDGEDHEGDVDSVIRQLKDQSIRVFPIGVGSVEGDLIPVTSPNGQRGFLKDRNDNVVKSSLDETILEQLARETGGAYVRSAPGDFGTERIIDQGLRDLVRDESEARIRRTHKDRFGWFLGVALLCFALEGLLGLPVWQGKQNGGTPR